MRSDPRFESRRAASSLRAGAIACVLLCAPSWVAAADADEIEELKRAIKALREENRELSKRVRALEDEKHQREQTSQPAVPPKPGAAPPKS